MELTENRTLRGGRSNWIADGDNPVVSDPLPDGRVDVAIVGAGIMGAMLAERLSSGGLSVHLFDRRPPAHGSTAVSTALVMWAADVPLIHLGERLGNAEAARRWRRVFAAVNRLVERIDRLAITCGRIDRPELYLAGTLLDEAELQAEGKARMAAGLPSRFLDADSVFNRFGIATRPALLSAGCYELDPVALTLGLLREARCYGARISFAVDIERLESRPDCVGLYSSDGQAIVADRVILASGYERPTWFLPPAFKVGSSYAIASPPGLAPQWRDNAMIWEASSPYVYARATADGRVIAGGEDESFDDAQQRDALIGEKAGTLQAKLAALTGQNEIAVDCAWAAAFGSSPDGLPAIGRAANQERVWLASGFGGNGVTFAALAAELIAAEFAGESDPDADAFNPYRFD